MVAFGQALSQFLSDVVGRPSVDADDIAFLKGEVGSLPALPLAGPDSVGYLASQPDLTWQMDQLQPLPEQVESAGLAPDSDIDLITAAGCASPSSPQMDPSARSKRKLLRERQNVQNECPNPMPLTESTSGSGSARNNNPYKNPRLYPGGQKRRIQDWFFGIRQEWKQCPPEKKTLCCTGAEEGLLVRSCANCTWLSKRGISCASSQLLTCAYSLYVSGKYDSLCQLF